MYRRISAAKRFSLFYFCEIKTAFWIPVSPLLISLWKNSPVLLTSPRERRTMNSAETVASVGVIPGMSVALLYSFILARVLSL